MSYKTVVVCDFCGAEELSGINSKSTFFSVTGPKDGKTVTRHMCPKCLAVAEMTLMEVKIKRDSLGYRY